MRLTSWLGCCLGLKPTNWAKARSGGNPQGITVSTTYIPAYILIIVSLFCSLLGWSTQLLKTYEYTSVIKLSRITLPKLGSKTFSIRSTEGCWNLCLGRRASGSQKAKISPAMQRWQKSTLPETVPEHHQGGVRRDRGEGRGGRDHHRVGADDADYIRRPEERPKLLGRPDDLPIRPKICDTVCVPPAFCWDHSSLISPSSSTTFPIWTEKGGVFYPPGFSPSSPPTIHL